MLNKKTSKLGSAFAFIISGVFILAAVWIFINRQYVLDQFSVWSYEPSAQMLDINERVAFTEKGTFVFYATKPSLEDQAGFNKECPRQEAGSPILGCYTSADRIFVYNITNEQLDGMEEVTSAHEMLHAAWYRMSHDEREKLTVELRAAYEKLDNPQLTERMEYYQRTEPGEFANELHSILGTEVASLGDSLEAYYEQYFDRETVVALHDKYNTVYTALYTRADDLFSKMEALSTSLEARNTAYEASVNQLSSDINDFNSRANGGSFSSQAQFNSERAALVRRSNVLNAERQAINTDVATYNEYYEEYQKISEQIQVLNESVDSFKQIEQAPSV